MNPNPPADKSPHGSVRIVPEQVGPGGPGETGTGNGPHDSTTPILQHPIPSIPDHELLRRIGGGSYGEVWLARSVLGHYRAVKVIYRDKFEHDRPFDREFEGIQKFEPISRVHESQVDILHVGRNDPAGYFYYVMELADDAGAIPNDECRNPTRCDGATARREEARKPNDNSDAVASNLRSSGFGIPSDFGIRNSNLYIPHTLKLDLYRRSRLPVDECIEIGLALTTALEHLHSHGLVHRDVKPSNIIFVVGVPKLADIGLVASMDATMSFVGTRGFLPPEGPGTPQADIYSLGKVLYEISMGRDRQEFPKLPPDLLVAASGENAAGPVLPEREGGSKSSALSRVAATALLELNAVILKACHNDPNQRYKSAQEMASDLALLRHGRSVMQKRARQQRWALCKKASLAAVLVVLAAIIALRFTRRGADDFVESSNPEVNSLVDRGNLAIRGETPERVRYAFECFKKAVELDPNFVPAHFGLAGAYIHLLDDGQMASLRATAQNLMKLDPSSAEALHIDAFVKWRDGKYREALAEAKRATQAHAVCKEGRAWAYVAHGFFLQNTGDADAALAQYRMGEKLYPAEPTIQDHLGHPYFMRSNLVEALKHYQKSVELQPGHVNGVYFLGRTYEEMGEFDKAIQEFEKLDRLYERNAADTKRFYDGLRVAVQEGGAAGYWHKRLNAELIRPSPDLYYIATLYAHVGEKDKAYEYLEKAFERHYCLEKLLFDLCWDRNDERFKAIARRIGLMH